MEWTTGKKIISQLLCIILMVMMAFTISGCNANHPNVADPSSIAVQSNVQTEKTVIGEGQTTFLFTVVDKDGHTTNFEIHTDKETVGDALLEADLISGETGEYGLYVKTVNGITADYDVDKTYWAFYINDEYALAGVDLTAIEDGTTYTFKVEQ